jgi:hypothetical protein
MLAQQAYLETEGEWPLSVDLLLALLARIDPVAQERALTHICRPFGFLPLRHPEALPGLEVG